MKSIYQILLLSALGIGSASAQLASDTPAPAAPAAAAAIGQTNTKNGKLASETDTLKTTKTARTQVADKTRKLASEAEAPRKTARVKNN
ncbi:hypothetical protein [Emticicia soli]|uniref:Uncharacterized protein n=1 Tax=Emticicia soli TaxID=2027878 RepID=A0ABW5JB15_9BACT